MTASQNRGDLYAQKCYSNLESYKSNKTEFLNSETGFDLFTPETSVKKSKNLLGISRINLEIDKHDCSNSISYSTIYHRSSRKGSRGMLQSIMNKNRNQLRMIRSNKLLDSTFAYESQYTHLNKRSRTPKIAYRPKYNKKNNLSKQDITLNSNCIEAENEDSKMKFDAARSQSYLNFRSVINNNVTPFITENEKLFKEMFNNDDKNRDSSSQPSNKCSSRNSSSIKNEQCSNTSNLKN